MPKRLLFPAGCLCFAILLGLQGAAYAPDAGYYRLLAMGQRSDVPAPFSERILGPAIAGWLGRSTGLGVDTGFQLLGVVCLIAFVALLAGLLWSLQARGAVFAAVFLMPFWVDIFHDYYLPDLLHAAILAAMLLLLLWGHIGPALLLLFPAYLTRESTALVALCLVFACWRRIRFQTALIGAGALLCAGVISRHYGQAGPISVHGMGGGAYLAGKVVWSFFKNVLGLPLWSNTLPECSPIWTSRVPFHLGAISTIGLCRPSVWGPARLLLAWFGIFGVGPGLAWALWPKMVSHLREATVVFRFCTFYGAICILMTPLLGASADRLVEYGWPLYFVAVPSVLGTSYDVRQPPRPGWILVLHLLTCWVAWFGFRQQQTIGYLLAGLVVLGLNGIINIFYPHCG